MKKLDANLIILIVFLFPQIAFAYLDPGSGSMLISTVIAVGAIIVYAGKSLIYDKINLFGKKAHAFDIHKNYDVVVYSEGKQYWNVFAPILSELDKQKVSALFLTSAEDDPGLNQEFQAIEKYYIGKNHQAFFTLNKLKARFVLMTTPGLDVLQIKRSKDVEHYCHVTHSAGTITAYKAHSLDYFDSVLVGGEADKNIIRALEEKRNLPKKQIEIVGCPYLDTMRARLAQTDYSYSMFTKKQTTVLLSPTWGAHSMLNQYGHEILNTLSRARCFNIIVRPHPQSYVSEKDMLEQLLQDFPESESLKWDKTKDALNSMYHADLMISDFSGIIYDFLFLFKRPVLSFSGQFDKRGKEAMDLESAAYDIQLLDKIGKVLKKDDVQKLPEIIAGTRDDEKRQSDMFTEARQQLAQFPGEAGKRVAGFIQKIIFPENQAIN